MPKAAVTKEPSFEEKLASIQARKKKSVPSAKKGWVACFGWAKDDPIYDEAMRLGAEWRAEVNRKSLKEVDRRNAHS